jgi:hypothetical protein
VIKSFIHPAPDMQTLAFGSSFYLALKDLHFMYDNSDWTALIRFNVILPENSSSLVPDWGKERPF